jgi:hypothetical protein
MNGPEKETRIASAVLFVLAGPLLWAGHLFLVYGVHSVTCAVGSRWIVPSALIQSSVIPITLGAMALLVLALRFPGCVARVLRYERTDRHSWTFFVRVARLLSLLSLMGVIWAGAAVFVLDACRSLR